MGFQWRASQRGIEVRNLEVSLQAQADNILVFLGLEEQGHPGLKQIEGRLYVDADGDEDVLQELWQETLRRSPVTQSFLRGARTTRASEGVMARWPLFPVTVVGQWPRPTWLLEAMKRGRADLHALQDEATLLAIKYQEDAGVDIVSDGEQRRDNFYSFICHRLDGIRLMTMADLLEYVEDKAAFETLLNALDVPAFAIKNPTVVGKLAPKGPLVLEDFKFLREHTRKAVKVTLPGPYLLSRSTWVKNLSDTAYPTREALADDIVQILRDELQALAAAGADIVQFDEPVLTELVFAGKSATRTFMCAALAASASPESWSSPSI